MSKFNYIISLERPLSDVKNVLKVTFDISRYGEYIHSIIFDHPVSEEFAVSKVEEYLSEPVTEDYYNNIKGDLFDDREWEDSKNDYSCRGDLLTSCIYLEEVEREKSHIYLATGS